MPWRCEGDGKASANTKIRGSSVSSTSDRECVECSLSVNGVATVVYTAVVSHHLYQSVRLPHFASSYGRFTR